MFQTSPRQYYANMSESVQDAYAGRAGGAKKAAKALFIAHVILPSAFYWVSAYTRNIVKDEDDRDDWDKLLKGWGTSMALGPLSGVFMWGQIANEMSSGYDYRLPIIEFGSEAKDGVHRVASLLSQKELEEITAQEVIKVMDDLATSVSLGVGGGATWYDIGTRFAKSVGVSNDDVNRVLMSEVEAQVYDYKKWKTNLYNDTKLESWDEGTKKTKERRKAEKETKKARYKELLKKAQEIKEKYPHAWEEIREGLKLPQDLIKEIE